MSGRALLVIAVGSLVLRVLYGLFILSDGSYEPLSDALHYHGIAEALADGRGFSHVFPFSTEHATAWRPPLYPMLLAGVYVVTGPIVFVGQLLGCLVGTAVVVLGTFLASQLPGRFTGAIAGVLLAVYPPLLASDVTILTESLSLFLLVCTVLLVERHRMLGAGVCTGLLMLTRPSAQALAAVFGAWVLCHLGWRKAIAFVSIALLIVTPWVLRNWFVFGRPLLVTSNGFNIAAIYSPEAMQNGWVDGVFDPRLAAVREGAVNEAALDESLRGHGVESLLAHPTYPLTVIARNVPRLFEIDLKHNDSAETLDGRSLRLRRASLPLFYLVTAVGLLGMRRLWQYRSGQLLVVATIYFTATSLAFITVPRLRAPLDLACVLGTAAVAGELVDRRRLPWQTVTPQAADTDSAQVDMG